MELGKSRPAGTIHIEDDSVHVQFKGGASIKFLVTNVPPHFSSVNDGRDFVAVLILEDSVIFFFEDGGFWASGTFDNGQMRELAEEVSKRLGGKRRGSLREGLWRKLGIFREFLG